MELVRLGNAGCTKTEDAVARQAEEGAVRVIFRAFGLGTEKTSDFCVKFTWKDVENLISEFAVMDEPSAVRLQQVKSLGIAVQRAGWHPKDVP